MRDLDTKEQSSTQTQRQEYNTKLCTEGTHAHTQPSDVLGQDTPLYKYTGGHEHTTVHPRASTCAGLTLLHIYTHTHPPSLSFSQLLFRLYPAYPPTLLPHGLGHLARCICVWSGRENLEKGRSKEREVGQRPWPVRGCPGHWPVLGINLNTIWPPAQVCSQPYQAPLFLPAFPTQSISPIL